MTSTGDVFLAVSAQAPQPNDVRHSILTPVIEDDEVGTDGQPTERPEPTYPELNLSDDHKKIFMTESKQTEYVPNKNNADEPEDVVDGPCERLNSDGENFDEIYSDSSSENSDAESKDGDYETDLEFDEESK